MRKIFAGAVAVVLGAVALPASAQETLNAFGAQGQFAIDAQGGVQLFEPFIATGAPSEVGMTPFVGWQYRSFSQPNNGPGVTHTYKTSAFYINPGVDYFVIDHLSIGGEVLIAHAGTSQTDHDNRTGIDTTHDGPGGTYLGLMPRVGYDIPLGASMFSIWPRGGIGFQYLSYSGGGQPDGSDTIWFFYADVPFMFHFAEHFFAGVGPGVTFSFSHSFHQGNVSGDAPGYTNWRLLSSTIGGYF